MSIYILRDILCREERTFGTDAFLGITIPRTHERGWGEFNPKMLPGGIASGGQAQYGITFTAPRATHFTDRLQCIRRRKITVSPPLSSGQWARTCHDALEYPHTDGGTATTPQTAYRLRDLGGTRYDLHEITVQIEITFNGPNSGDHRHRYDGVMDRPMHGYETLADHDPEQLDRIGAGVILAYRYHTCIPLVHVLDHVVRYYKARED